MKFSEITQENIVEAIKAYLKGDRTYASKYAIWWKGKLVSPSGVISKHYELIGKPIDRNSFDTSEAQKVLLNLGFPIVDTSVQDSFFSKKELNSFEVLVKNKYYDKNSPVDKNIGEFISKVIWEKTKIWREKLLELDWFKDNNRYSWQIQSKSEKGNIYRDYTWFKVFPNNNIKKLIFFTLGVGGDGNLYYKIDIKRNDDFFKQNNRIREFDSLMNSMIEEDTKYAVIKKEDIEHENWSTLIRKTDAYFTDKLTITDQISSHFWPERRLMRLVWNDKNWKFPISRYWNKNWQGRTDKAHHEQYGFGSEEWLFNNRYLIEGTQYGYVRGIDTMPETSYFIDELYLYSLHPKTKQQFLIAKLFDVEIYREEEIIDELILSTFENNRDLMLDELKQVNADTKFLKTLELRPNMSFDLNRAIIYEEPILLNQDLLKIHRFIPNKIKDEIELAINEIETSFKKPKIKFESGNGTGSNSYSQSISGGKRNVNRTHADITNDLHEYLTNSKVYKKFEISTEKTRVGNNLVDCAAKSEDEYILFEVKTTNSVLTNIRQALGQIIEYALLDTSLNVNKLIIIGPAIPNERDLVYFQNLKEQLKLPLQYWSYSFEEKKMSNKFQKF
ncbi:hypothetical protein H2O64_02725 [Kordia sp. YSTF-M3]|uniref:Uncharacterized protein n=1 Tax=Kordia aestuariivivens TaxID=2759037 RepID=A0ABR7Q4S4_9FLAO|nr:hypothetical protein [Kordia aestuariivivens]MBC8753569.1 hypothetical protein [Kordia aestuariivivens]